SISISGATNSGSGGAAAVTGTFLVVGVSADQKTITLYMPYSGIGTIGLGTGTTLGTGPWVTAIPTAQTTPVANPPLQFNNNVAGTRWDAHNISVSANGLAIKTTNTSFTDPLGGTGTKTAGHIGTWDGINGFTQARDYAFDFYGMPADSSSTA